MRICRFLVIHVHFQVVLDAVTVFRTESMSSAETLFPSMSISLRKNTFLMYGMRRMRC